MSQYGFADPIEESGMVFRSLQSSNLYYIEKSEAYRRIGQGYKSVEFVYLREGGIIDFIEAKSGAPRLGKADSSDFDKFKASIVDKYLHSFQLFLSVLLGRNVRDGLGQGIACCEFPNIRLRFLLIINDLNDVEALQTYQEVFRREMSKLLNIWHVTVMVIDDKRAREMSFID
jgi:hypothetical protein